MSVSSQEHLGVRALHVCVLPPIDWWGTLPTLEQVLGKAEPAEVRRETERLWAQAQTVARKHGWEGDVRGSVYVVTEVTRTFTPPTVSETATIAGVVWKQENNGTCFLVSLLPMAAEDAFSVHIESLAVALQPALLRFALRSPEED